MESEQFSELLQSRRSVRDFRPDPISEDVWQAILNDARHCPSWSNTRPYCLAVATGEGLERLRSAYVQAFDRSLPLQRASALGKLKALATGKLPDADFPTWRPYPPGLKERSVQVGKALFGHIGIARGDQDAREAHNRRNCEFFGAPLVVWVFVHSDLMPFAAQDAGLMEQTLMLAAAARGVGSCALGVLATWRGLVDAEFQVPKDYKLITGIAFGYPSDAHVNDFRAEHPPIELAPAKEVGSVG
ncbi:MAG: nitroreductase [Actinomycetaceae bacterium]|nr:nitroreductase [Actinomycetaceae bacterium]